MEVQIFGTRDHVDTKKALRFFSERGIRTHFVDLKTRPPSPGELKRFLDRFGVEELIDRESRRFRQLGLAAAPPSTARWVERLLAEPLILRQPLVRHQGHLSVGLDEGSWKAWAADSKRG